MKMLASVIILAAFLGGIGLSKYPFWDDEAETALFARNIVQIGSRTAWNGSNLAAFRGGIDLDDRLNQDGASPLQFYVAAASFKLLGVGTIQGRLPFLLAGLAALWFLERGARSYLGHHIPSWLPSLLLALNVSFLLFTTQCRYYALSMMTTAALLWAWSSTSRGSRPVASCLGGATAMWALFETNYMDAAAMAVACAAACAHPAMRRGRSLIFLAAIAVPLGAGVVSVLSMRGPLDAWSALRGTMPPFERAITLMKWQLTGLGAFEFFPALVLPILGLPWIMRQLRNQKPLALLGLTAALMLLAFLVVLSVVSPQNPQITSVADMRYDVPVIVIGSLATGSAIGILAAAGWSVCATCLFSAIVLTNAFYVGPDRLRCTLCDRLNELQAMHPSGVTAMLIAAAALPAGTSVVVRPDYMVRPLMFYRTDLRYPGLLASSKRLDPTVRRSLPKWVFCCDSAPDVILLGLGSISSVSELPLNGSTYREERKIRLSWVDRTRPELPWHNFSPDASNDQESSIVVLRRSGKPLSD